MRHSKSQILTSLALIAAFAASVVAGAQDGPPPGGPPPGGRPPGQRRGPDATMQVVHMSTVQKHLNLTKEQIEKIDALRPPGPPRGPDGPPRGGGEMGPPPRGERMEPPPGPDLQGGPPKDNPLAKILNTDQMERLGQLALQYDAPMSMLRPDVARRIGLTDGERQQIDGVIRENLPRPEPGQRPDWKEMQRRKAAALAQALAILDNDQKRAWSALIGVKFENWEEPKPPRR